MAFHVHCAITLECVVGRSLSWEAKQKGNGVVIVFRNLHRQVEAQAVQKVLRSSIAPERECSCAADIPAGG